MYHKTLRWFLICRKINITESREERGGGGGGGRGGGIKGIIIHPFLRKQDARCHFPRLHECIRIYLSDLHCMYPVCEPLTARTSRA